MHHFRCIYLHLMSQWRPRLKLHFFYQQTLHFFAFRFKMILSLKSPDYKTLVANDTFDSTDFGFRHVHYFHLLYIIGTIGLVDYDVVDLSNLHRQTLHTEDNVGTHKVDSAIEYLHRFCLIRNIDPRVF